MLIEEFEKLYDEMPEFRARIQSGIALTKRLLLETQTKYDAFLRYKARTAISK
jgi:hypothetical protein